MQLRTGIPHSQQ